MHHFPQLSDPAFGTPLSKDELFFFAMLLDPRQGSYFVKEGLGPNNYRETSADEGSDAHRFAEKLLNLLPLAPEAWDEVRSNVTILKDWENMLPWLGYKGRRIQSSLKKLSEAWQTLC